MPVVFFMKMVRVTGRSFFLFFFHLCSKISLYKKSRKGVGNEKQSENETSSCDLFLLCDPG